MDFWLNSFPFPFSNTTHTTPLIFSPNFICIVFILLSQLSAFSIRIGIGPFTGKWTVYQGDISNNNWHNTSSRNPQLPISHQLSVELCNFPQPIYSGILVVFSRADLGHAFTVTISSCVKWRWYVCWILFHSSPLLSLDLPPAFNDSWDLGVRNVIQMSYL